MVLHLREGEWEVDRTALLLAWLEGEGERHRRPLVLAPTIKHPVPRGWVHVVGFAVGGTLVAGLLLCWLDKSRELAARMRCSESLRQVAFRWATGDPTPPWEQEKKVTATSNKGEGDEWVCFRLFAIAFGTVIGAWFLRGGVGLSNLFAGGKDSLSSVPALVFWKAMIITFVTALVPAVLGVHLVAGLIGLLVMAALLAALLPTTFVRGLLVTLCYLLVGGVVIGVLIILIAGLILVRGALK